MMIVIDLVGDDGDEELKASAEEAKKKKEHEERLAREDAMRRAPQPLLVPVDITS